MIWWLKARGVPAIGAAILGTFLLALVVRQEAIPVPSVLGSSSQLLVTQILGVFPAVLLLHGIDRGDVISEEVALRHRGRRNVALCFVFAFVSVALAAAVQLSGDRPEALSLARNSVGFLGAALIMRALLGPGIAAICVATLPLACAVAGRNAGGTVQPWAWPIHEPSSDLGAAEAAILFVVGCAFLLWRRRPVLDPLGRPA
ncbi:hypothetical protein [Streptomyces sp. ISL-100]|uniref:hypothetical protein n=1 Tax=Streptomyces sp. ISL-100 TaxID=2819173 RepID=UPI001BECB112|nr:hypothetical protein [Streptomyces sp. ISL-100]MBT2401638.1 hypothetical protein [Streptomyces sp. ISL-100]